MSVLKFSMICVLVSFTLILFGQKNNSQQYTHIVYYGDKSKNSTTYMGKVRKGDPGRLQSELNYSNNYSGNVASEKSGPNTDAENYIRYLSRQEKKKNRSEMRHLSDLYSVDEKKLSKGNKREREKYFEEKELMFVERDKLKSPKKKKKNSKVYSFEEFQKLSKDQNKANSYIARNYKISGKKFRKGKKYKYPAGPVSMFIKYKIRDGRTVRTYIDVVEAHLKPDALYELKYHGKGASRQYFLEYQQVPRSKKER